MQIAARYDLIAPMYANFSDDVRPRARSQCPVPVPAPNARPRAACVFGQATLIATLRLA